MRTNDVLTESDRILRIMNFTGSIYECWELSAGQNIDTFKKMLRNPRHVSRFIMFQTANKHPKYQIGLENDLDYLTEGRAVIRMNKVLHNGKVFLIDRDSPLGDATYLSPVTIIDRDKLNVAERAAIRMLIENTQVKMQLNQREIELEELQSKVDKMSEGIAQIRDAANKAKSSLGSRNVNALKKVVAEVAEKTK